MAEVGHFSRAPKHSKPARHFVGTDSILAIGDHPHSREPLFERHCGVLEDRSDFQRELRPFVFAIAFPDPSILKVGYLFGVTDGATGNSIGPSQPDHELAAVLVIAKELHRSASRMSEIASPCESGEA